MATSIVLQTEMSVDPYRPRFVEFFGHSFGKFGRNEKGGMCSWCHRLPCSESFCGYYRVCKVSSQVCKRPLLKFEQCCRCQFSQVVCEDRRELFKVSIIPSICLLSGGSPMIMLVKF